MKLRDWRIFGLGFLALALGNAVGAVHMFRGNVSLVTTGVGLMVGGFQIMHYGSHGSGLVTLSVDRSSESLRDTVETWLVPPALLLAAVFCIAQGFSSAHRPQ
jgi:hypothetical protein